MKSIPKPLSILMVLAILAGMLGMQPAKPVQAVSPDVRISQVYGGGGGVGASYISDFIELFNAGSSTVSLAGMSVQYANSPGTVNFGATEFHITVLPDVELGAGQYYLIRGNGGSNGSALPEPDHASSIAMNNTNGKVVLVNSPEALDCNGGENPCSSEQLALIIDLVGYGDADFSEGSEATPGLSTTTAAIRHGGGCTDTDNNAADFEVLTPTPRNTASTSHSCEVTEVIGSTLRLSQVYGGGGNSGAPYTHDFIELFNSGSSPVSLAGMSVQYASAAGTGNFGANEGQLTELPDVTINPGQYYLIQEADGTTGDSLPTPDHVDPTPINMSATNGKVALVNSATTLGCNGGSTLCSPEQLALIVDLVGFGSANFYEGAGAVPTLSNTTAALRKGNGCTDTDDNSADFDVLTPAPRNTATPAQTCGPIEIIPTDLFFSEYIEGSGNNKALEIYNGTGASVDLTDYQILYYNNAGLDVTITYPLAGTVANGDVFVLTTDQAAQELKDAADVILAYPSVVHFNGDDVIALQKISTSAMLDVIGQIGVDPGVYWGTPPITTAEYTLTRMETICTGDTDGYDSFDPADEWIAFPQNDFSYIGAHQTNCGPAVDIPPTVTSTLPADGATNIAPDANITITFSEPVTVADGWYTISCANSGAHTAVVDASANPIFTLNPATNFTASELCTVTLAAEHVSDQDDPIAPMEANYAFSFTIAEGCGGDFTPIYDIQGSGMSTPISGQTVTTEGVVVGDFQTGGKNGFYIQDEDGDGDEATSDGVFIYYVTAPDVVVGDKVRVTGKVSEYNGATQVTGSAMQICSSGNVIEPTEISLPVDSVNDFEKYEGMLVTFPQSLIISEYFNYDRYGEMVLTSQRHMTPTAIVEPGAPAQAAAEAYLLDRITLDDGRTPQNIHPAIHPNGLDLTLENLFRGGGTLTDVTGIMDYMFDLYRIQPTQGAIYSDVNPRSAAPDIIAGDLTVASFNVLNYFVTLDGSGNRCGPSGNMECRGADNAAELERQRAKILSALDEIDADVYGLMEIENDRPSGDDPVADLVAGLNDIQGAGSYAYIETGSIGTDAIKQAILYKPTNVTPVGDYKVLDSSVDARFIDTANRPVLAQIFEDNASGEQFIVAVNHLKSKGSACTGDPDLGDGAGNCNLTRLAAAQAMVDWLADTTVFGDVDKVLIIGDLNSYDKEDPIDAIKLGSDDSADTEDDYLDMIFEKQGDEAYGYVFDGQIGYLDYALANLALAEHIVDANLWHINADEPDIIDYDNSFKPAEQAALLYAPDAYRSSDHDPVIVTLSFSSPVLEAVLPEEGLISLGTNDSFVLTVDAYDLDLYSLEVDHSFEGTLPEFTVYADAANPWGSAEAKAGFDAAGMTISYDEGAQKWTIDFGAAITNTYFIPNGVTFYLVLHDEAGNTWGSMYEVTPENTFAYTFEVTNTLEAEITAAVTYEYPPSTPYEYVGDIDFNDPDNIFTASYTPAEFLANGAMNDLARYLGALYRQDISTIIKITFNGVEYTWDPTGTLKGSNWEDASGNTLVSAMVAYYFSTEYDPTDGMTITVHDGWHTANVTFKLVILSTLDAELASAPDYEYDDSYIPVGIIDFDLDSNTYTGTYTAPQVLAGAPMNDLARYLGALYRQDNATITSIVYNGKTYTWDATGTLIGSNWEDASGKTLVSQVTDDFQAAILAGTWDPEAGFVMSVHDDYDHSATVTFKLVILNTLDTEIGSAKAYVYDPVYPYVGSWAFDDPNNVYTMTYDDTTFAPGAMNDLARYLGALYRQSGSTVAAILYDGTTYTWDTTGSLLGSNWEDDDGKTLVSAITADVLAGEVDPDVGLILTLSDVFHTENVTFKAVINDTTNPVLVAVTPPRGDVYLADGENFVLTVEASDDNLYSLEVDHSFEGTLPEFTVYADADDPWGDPDSAAWAASLGVVLTYDEDDQIWTIDFGPTITETFITDGVTFYLVLFDQAGNTWGSMYDVTPENTFAYTLIRDDVDPVLEAVTPERGVVYLAGGENFVLTVDALDLNLYSLEVDHSYEGTLPEFTVYADAANPWGSAEAKAGFDAAGMTISYDEGAQKWTIDFGAVITNTYFIPDGVTFYLVLHDAAGNQWGTMYGTTPENTFAYTFVRDDVAPTLVSVTPPHDSTILLGIGDTFSLTIEAEDDNLYELEIDHSMETTLPEFSVYASEADPYGGDEALFAAQGVSVTYDDETQTWVIDFGAAVSGLIADNGGITFYLVLEDMAGNQWGSMYDLTPENTFKYTVSQDLAAPTIVSGEAIGATGFDDVDMVGTTFTVPQGYEVDHIDFTMSEAVSIVAPGIVYFEGNPYGTMTAAGNVITVTPYPGNETAGVPGTFTFTIAAGSVTDLAGNPLETLTATMVVETSPIFDITDFGPWGISWPGAYNLGWGYVPLFDTTTIESIEVGMLDADRKSIVTYTAEGDQIVWQRDNGYITAAKLSSAPFYRVYNGNPIAEGADLDWTVIFGESFDAWSPAWGYVEVTDIYGTTVYHEIEYTGDLGDLTAPEIDEAIAIGSDPFDDVTAVDLTFTVPQGYSVEKIEITMSEAVTVVDGTEVTLAGIPYGSIGVDDSGLVLTVTPYAGNEVASRIGTFVFSVPAGKIFDISGNPLVTLEASLIVENIVPVAFDDAYTVVEDQVLTVGVADGVLANDTDFDPSVLTAVLVEAPANGDLTLDADGSFVYTPDANYFGTDTFSYKANDGHDDSNLATVTITVTYVKDQVVAVDDQYETDEDTTLTVAAPGVLENDTDVDLNLMSAALVTTVEHGQLTLNGDGSFVYIPDADWYGEDSFVYQLVTYPAPQNLWTDEATVTITVNPVNDAPVAQDQSVNTAEDTAVGITLVAIDVEDDELTYEIVDQPEHGTLTLVGNVATYTPDLDYNGVDSFTFTANDGTVDSNIALVSITVTPVNDAPIAQNQSVSTPEDTAIDITLVATDVDEQPLTYAIVTQPAHGTVSLIGNVATYTPSLNYHGTDSFTFKANDGIADSNVATVSITVSAVNDAPVAVDDAYMVEESGELTINAPGVLKNDTDVDGDSLTAILVDDVTNGTLTLNANGSFVYTPTAYFNGTDSFTYKASDGTLQSDLAVVTITVTPVNEWVIANDDYYETLADEILVKDAAEGVLANDVLLDPEEIVSIQIMESPEFGTLTINDDGSFTYIPDAGFMGTDTFRYLVMSVNPVTLQGEWSDDAFVTIVVKPFQMIYLPLMFK